MRRTATTILLTALIGGVAVWQLLPSLLSTESFMPHGHCYLWEPWLVRLHVSSDALIALSYCAISITLLVVVRRRRDLPFSWMILSFGMFIIACGATHFMEIVTLWTPVYWLSGSIKLITAAASVVTALLLPPLVPKIVALPSPAVLTAKNRELEQQATSLREQAHLLELAHDAIVVRSGAGTITFWNRAAEELYGWSSEEAIGKASAELLKTETDAPMARILVDFEREGRWEGEVTQARKDGTRIVVASRWALRRAAADDEGGDDASTLEICRDITEQKRLAEQRAELAREREEARAAAQAEIIRRQEELLVEMSTPIIPITDRIVVMPLIGTMDDKRAAQVLDSALSGAESRRAEVVILDVTGMRQLDTAVARTLIETASALRLLGARTILTGMRSEAARTLVGMDVDLTGIVTCSTLQRGIAVALGRAAPTS